MSEKKGDETTETESQQPEHGGFIQKFRDAIRIVGEGITDRADYKFKYEPPGFAVSDRTHAQDLPPLEWVGRAIERLTLETVGPYLPQFLGWLHTPHATADEKLDDDDFVAASQVSGFNPLVIRRARDRTFLEQRFPGIFTWTFDANTETFAEAFDDGRIYYSDYYELQTIGRSKSQPKKRQYAPIGVFRVPPARPLEIVAIKTNQALDASVYRPGDGQWAQAKLVLNCADANYHEIISHLGRTHLLIEPFAVSTYRIFDENNWLRRLLEPHFAGTLNINALAFQTLIDTDGSFDQLLCGDLESELELSLQSILHPGIRELMPPRQLAERDVMDDRLNYPYRDDALLLWDAYHKWVTAFTALHCANDEAVANDALIRRWVSDLTEKGKVAGLGEITTRADLVDVLTMIIFTASAQHAAVNFPQAALMHYAEAVPLAVYGDVNTATLDQMIPPDDMRNLQRQVADLLAGVYFTKIGDYAVYGFPSYSSVVPTRTPGNPLDFPKDDLVFKNPAELTALENFRHDLEDARQAIVARNTQDSFRQRFPYWYLHPDNIPQSINI